MKNLIKILLSLLILIGITGCVLGTKNSNENLGATVLFEYQGGVGTSTYVVGDILYSGATNDLTSLPVGANDEVLTLAGGVPTWAASAGGSGGSSAWEEIWTGAITPTTTNAGLYVNGSSTINNTLRVTGKATTTQSLWIGTSGSPSIDMDGGDLFVQDDLDVADDIIATYFYPKDRIIHEGDADTYMAFDSNEWDFYAGNSQLLILQETAGDVKRVGIATTTPGGTYGELLTVSGNTYIEGDLNISATSTFYDAIRITAPDGKEGWDAGQGMVEIDNSLNNGTALRIYTDNNDAYSASLIHIEVDSVSGSNQGPIMRIVSTATTSEGLIRLDSPSPEIEMIETDCPGGDSNCDWEFRVQNDYFQVNSRNQADSSFQKNVAFQSIKAGGTMQLVDPAVGEFHDFDFARISILSISATTSNYFAISSNDDGGGEGWPDGDIFIVDSNGDVGIGRDAPTSTLVVGGDANFEEDLRVGGKLTVVGSTDPRGVSFTNENCESARQLFISDEIKDEVMQFWNSDNNRFEYYYAPDDICLPLGQQSEPTKPNYWYLLGLLGLLGFIPKKNKI